MKPEAGFKEKNIKFNTRNGWGAVTRSIGRDIPIIGKAYARLKRLEKVCMMLLADSSIKEIAEATGFCDRHHFSRVFKRVHGIGPAEFHRTHQPPFPGPPTTSL